MTIWSASICLEIFFSISVNIKWELLDLLPVHQMDVHWMLVRRQVDKVEIVNFSNLESAVGTVHSIHH
jgi:hypothetical protein